MEAEGSSEGVGLDVIDVEELLASFAEELSQNCACDHEINNLDQNQHSRKRSDDTEIKIPRKVTRPNAYNIFTGDFYKSEEGKSIKSNAEKNKIAAKKWKELPATEKDEYFKQAKEQVGVRQAPKNSWKEASRIIKNMESNVNWSEQCEIPMLYVLCHEKNYYCGGTTQGKKYLTTHHRIPEEFLHFVNVENKTVPLTTSTNRDEWETLRKAVQSIFNMKYAAAIGKPKARVPYSSLSPSSVKNFPAGLKFGPPSSFSARNLRRILDVAEDIEFVGNSTLPMPLLEHSYYKLPSEPIKVPNVVKHTGGTLITSLNDDIDADVPLESERTRVTQSRKKTNKITTKPKKGSVVELLYKGKAVAKATVLDGSLLHGNSIPIGYIKLSIKEMERKDLQVPLQIKGPFDDDFLESGIITAWKLSDICYG